MISSKEIKQRIKPTIAVQYYLGQPVKSNRIGMWYKSPFRSERTESFLVSDIKGIHDFGTSEHYDVIDFTQKLFKIDFKTAVMKLSSDFGIIDSGQSSNELNRYLIKRREEEIELKQKLNSWFYKNYNLLCEKLHEINKLIPHLRGEALAIIYKQKSKIEYWTETFITATEEDKYELYKSRGEIEKCLNL